LANADTSQIVHNLYVKLVAPGDPDAKSRSITLSTLKYVHSRLQTFSNMGLVVRVNKIRSQDLQDPRLVDAMRRRGITRLPALTTPNNVYLGLTEISDIYERNIGEFAATNRREEPAVTGSEHESDLDAFYRSEMTFAQADDDAQETGIGEGDDMMNSYRNMMERREGGTPRPPTAGRPTTIIGDRNPAPVRSAPGRPDNVRPARSADPEEAEIQDTIDRLSADIDDNLRERAFAGGGGDSLDDDGDSFQDDLMERAYYANMSNSEY
jgi:hypothetical protein